MALTPKSSKGAPEKESFMPISLMNIHRKNFNKIFANQI
jgi:hypothetical protein